MAPQPKEDILTERNGYEYENDETNSNEEESLASPPKEDILTEQNGYEYENENDITKRDTVIISIIKNDTPIGKLKLVIVRYQSNI